LPGKTREGRLDIEQRRVISNMRVFALLTAVVFSLSMAWPSLAEESSSTEETPPPAAEEGSPEEASDDEASDDDTEQPLLDKGQLDQLVAPIALYPDTLLSQVLIAATYPLEVVQADRWVLKNKELKGEALDKALTEQDWDDSIKGLTVVPDVLALMNNDLDWTAKLGDAVLAQQADVMDAVQRLRERAKANGMLESNEQQTVKVEDEAPEQPAAAEPAEPQTTTAAPPPPQQVIVIEQAKPETVYVPYYDPAVVYGTWPYTSYPPYYFRPAPGYIVGGALVRGMAWGAGFAIGNAIWGNGFNWRSNNIHVNVNRNVNINNRNVNANWNHNSVHRRGVNYSNKNVQKKYGKGNAANKRPDHRGRGDGRPGAGDRRPGGGDKRPGAGDKRPGGGDKRPGGGLGDKKPGVGDKRPGGGDKRPGGGLGDKKPGLGDKRPNVGDMEKALKKKPDVGQRPNAKRPSGNAFDQRDGAKAKDFSKRGKDSLGNRSATKAARPSPAKKKPAAQRPKPKKKPAAKKPQHRPAAKKSQHRPTAKRSPAKRPSAHRPSGARKGGGGGGNRGRGGGGRGGGGRRR
jgi:hypothetical protein